MPQHSSHPTQLAGPPAGRLQGRFLSNWCIVGKSLQGRPYTAIYSRMLQLDSPLQLYGLKTHTFCSGKRQERTSSSKGKSAQKTRRWVRFKSKQVHCTSILGPLFISRERQLYTQRLHISGSWLFPGRKAAFQLNC